MTQTPAAILPPRRRRPAFTLTELLIVIAIMVLIMGLAVPAFKAMTGGRSIDAAANNLGAIVSRARTEAIALQKHVGVLFYIDPSTDRVTAGLVHETAHPGPGSPLDPDAVYFDLAPDGGFIQMPVGIGVQVIDNAATTTATGTPPVTRRSDDGYIGFNELRLPSAPDPAFAGKPTVGGMLMFDSAGKLASKQYRLLVQAKVGAANAPSELYKVLRGAAVSAPSAVEATAQSAGSPLSSVGVILYDLNDFANATEVPATQTQAARPITATTITDPQNTGAGYGGADGDEAREEAWLDTFGEPFLVSRHSGALLRNR